MNIKNNTEKQLCFFKHIFYIQYQVIMKTSLKTCIQQGLSILSIGFNYLYFHELSKCYQSYKISLCGDMLFFSFLCKKHHGVINETNNNKTHIIKLINSSLWEMSRLTETL